MYSNQEDLRAAKMGATEEESRMRVLGSVISGSSHPTPRPTVQSIIEATIANLHRAKDFNRQSRTKLTGPWPEPNEPKQENGPVSLMEMLQSLNDLSLQIANSAQEIADQL